MSGVWSIDRYGGVEGHPDHLSLGLHLVGAVAEVLNKRGKVVAAARPAAVRVCGPLVGGVLFDDPDRLRYEAARLLHVARLLELEQAPAGIDIPLDFQAMP